MRIVWTTPKWIARAACAGLFAMGAGLGFAQVQSGAASAYMFHKSFANLPWKKMPQFGGEEAVFYRSPDGKKVGVAFRESGKAHFKYTFDEIAYVVAGSSVISVNGGPKFKLAAGDVFHFKEGTVIDEELSADFADIAFIWSDTHKPSW